MPTGNQRQRLRSLLSFTLKFAVTIAAFYVLLQHPVHSSSGEQVSALQAILNYLPRIDRATFWWFALLAFVVRTSGMACSMLRWNLLLRGQGLCFPFWHVVTTFLIGRFLGTFLPSTIGLDGYKLYDAAKYSGRSAEAAAATVVEKGLGIVGIFLCFLVTFPLGQTILGARAAMVGWVTIPVAAALTLMFFAVLFHPRWLLWWLDLIPGLQQGRIGGFVTRLHSAAAAYRGQKQRLAIAAGLSFFVHFLTAVTYFFTAIAVGAHHAEFWEVIFASTIQIFATVMSPFTIAGEGVREIVQALLLAHRIGLETSILSAALGFWVAEAPTLTGGIFYLMRDASYRPAVRIQPPAAVAASGNGTDAPPVLRESSSR
ncbi:MAG: flippase-like domain-containing protein [Candidatus Binatia bacterium]|nr:flippase-like domain-containing protein [Candidatus Binatia bacterium]